MPLNESVRSRGEDLREPGFARVTSLGLMKGAPNERVELFVAPDRIYRKAWLCDRRYVSASILMQP